MNTSFYQASISGMTPRVIFISALALLSVLQFFRIRHQQSESLQRTYYTPSSVWKSHSTTDRIDIGDLLTIEGDTLATVTNSTNITNSSLSFVNYDSKLTLSTISTSGHSMSPPLCTHKQVIDGHWKSTLLENGPPFLLNESKLCYSRSFLQKRPFPYWEWVPFDSSPVSASSNNAVCEWTKWNTSLFCDLLPAATIYIAGDSLSKEHYLSLIRLLGSPEPAPVPLTDNFKMKKTTVCEGNTQILFQRDYRLDIFVNRLLSEKSAPPTVLIINRGAHYVDDAVLLKQLGRTLDQIKLWLRRCQQYKLHCHFFYRTTVPGHVQCNNFTEPVNNLTAMEAWIADESNYNNITRGYIWNDFNRQNELILNELNHRNVSFIHLDAYHINVLRPDGHQTFRNDCLHNCAPGKTEVFSQLLLHELRKVRTKEQAKQHARIMQSHAGWLDEFNVTVMYEKEQQET